MILLIAALSYSHFPLPFCFIWWLEENILSSTLENETRKWMWDVIDQKMWRWQTCRNREARFLMKKNNSLGQYFLIYVCNHFFFLQITYFSSSFWYILQMLMSWASELHLPDVKWILVTYHRGENLC